MPGPFEKSEQYDDWVDETGGNDEALDDYYDDWQREQNEDD
ncbi:hypothetical protein ACPV5L_02110 [Vibrio astriarenae]